MISNTASTSGSGSLPSNTIANPKSYLKAITTRSGVSYQGPTIPTTSSSSPKVVERKTEVTKDTVPPTNNGSTKDVQPSVVQPQVPNYKPVVAPVSAPKPNSKPSIPYPSRLNDYIDMTKKETNNQIEKIPTHLTRFKHCPQCFKTGGLGDCKSGNLWDKVCKVVGRHRGEERGIVSCLIVRTRHTQGDNEQCLRPILKIGKWQV
ncbi:hypothetical protein Tco_0422630 [Tanacetum coccineum]